MPEDEEIQKRNVIRLMRTKGITATEACDDLNIPWKTLTVWLAHDKEFIAAWEAISLVRAIDIILAADDLVRSGKELTPGEMLYVENGRGLLDDITHLGLFERQDAAIWKHRLQATRRDDLKALSGARVNNRPVKQPNKRKRKKQCESKSRQTRSLVSC